MTRTGATVFGLTLVVLSIAFNTMRYPVVWKMAGSVRPEPSAQPLAASMPEKPDGLACARPPQRFSPPSPVGAGDLKPIAEVAGQTVDGAVSAQASPPDRAGSDSNGDGGPEAQKPMVPVVRDNWPTTPQGGAEFAAGVRRLPPVDRPNPVRADRGVFAGPMPAYPSTGI